MDTTPAYFDTRARGKLLLTGEYFVLDGAEALAMPVRYGQTLRVEPGEDAVLDWTSCEQDGMEWFRARFSLPGLLLQDTTDTQTATTLKSILEACRRQKPAFLSGSGGIQVTTEVDFPRSWGLGTSSTLIAAMARWAGVDPYAVLFSTLGGSGYDVACAYAVGPLFYRLDDKVPQVQEASFRPGFSEGLYFVHLTQKQDSREGIRHYRDRGMIDKTLIEEVSQLSRLFVQAESIAELDRVIRQHEKVVSFVTELPRARDLYFGDFWGEVKSLGAWGGDFVLVTSEAPEAETRAYFAERGYHTFISWADMAI
ncbi:MAG: hypothetical protein KDC61_22200 [Saprospiraceae bacterium]|nr:hypothetical protein [Saprospiraceae bacterium]MCB9353094.1 GHMP kinase [Lewinellaceae bacterium]